jgi:hypothetical protein
MIFFILVSAMTIVYMVYNSIHQHSYYINLSKFEKRFSNLIKLNFVRLAKLRDVDEQTMKVWQYGKMGDGAMVRKGKDKYPNFG